MILEMPERWPFMSDEEIRQWQRARRAEKGEPEPPTMERRIAAMIEQKMLDRIKGQ